MHGFDLLRFIHPLFPEAKLGTKPVAVKIGDESYVVFRQANGKVSAVEDKCAHRFAKLSDGKIINDRIQCMYHNWSFDGEGKGYCPSQPSLKIRPISSFQVIEKLNYYWLCKKEVVDQDFFTQLSRGFRFVGSFNVLFDAPMHVVFANFSEAEHLPYVHDKLGWEEKDWAKVEFNVDIQSTQTEVSYRGPQKYSLQNYLFGIFPGDVFQVAWKSEFNPPRTTFNYSWTDKSNQTKRPMELSTTIFFVPEGNKTRVHVFPFAKFKIPLVDIIWPLLRPLIYRAGQLEIEMDAKIMKSLEGTPESFAGMSLGLYDKPVVLNQKLIERIYLNSSGGQGSERELGEEPC